MFFILSKVLTFLISPLLWCLTLFAIGLLKKGTRTKKRFLISSFVLMLFFSNNFMSELCFSAYEANVVSIDSLDTYDYGVILTGVLQTKMEPRDRVYFNKGADRVTHPLQLYKQGVIKNILISGGSGELIGDKVAEADLIYDFLILAGVPANHILIENKSRNTKENAKFTADLLKENNKESASLLLVTSAFHMRRAQGCFHKVGLDVTSFPADFRTAPLKASFSNLLIPSTEAFGKWDLLIHEMVGLMVYKLTGNA